MQESYLAWKQMFNCSSIWSIKYQPKLDWSELKIIEKKQIFEKSAKRSKINQTIKKEVWVNDILRVRSRIT